MSNYIPSPPVKEDPSTYTFRELQDLARALAEPQSVLYLQVLHAVPIRPRQGMVVYADGTDWDPGSGVGMYQFNGSAWVFLA